MFSERNIYIISPQTLLGDLMASQIKNHTDAACHVVAQIEEISPLPSPLKKSINLHLVDCHGKDIHALEEIISTNFQTLTRSGYYALFNLERNLGIEKKALSQGAKGFFYVNDGLEIMLRGIRLILEGELWASRKAITDCLFSLPAHNRIEKKSPVALTKRETDILSLVVEGDDNQTIASSLYISPHTVRTHLHHIFKKLKVKNRLQAAQWANRNL